MSVGGGRRVKLRRAVSAALLREVAVPSAFLGLGLYLVITANSHASAAPRRDVVLYLHPHEPILFAGALIAITAAVWIAGIALRWRQGEPLDTSGYVGREAGVHALVVLTVMAATVLLVEWFGVIPSVLALHLLLLLWYREFTWIYALASTFSLGVLLYVMLVEFMAFPL